MSLVLVTGATGALGPSVARAFVDAGFAVRAMSRSGRPPSGMQGFVDPVGGDITRREDVARAVRGVDIVVHLAALLHARPGLYTDVDYHRTNVAATESLVAEACAAGTKRFLFASSICVYGDATEAVIDERTPAQPNTAYGVSKLEAEKSVLAATDAAGNPLGVVLRLAAVYGPGVKGNYLRLLRALEMRVAVRIGTGGNRRTLVSEWDAARAFVAAATHPLACGRVYNVSDGHIHTLNHIVGAMQAALGKKSLPLVLPYRAARLMASTADAVLRPFGIVPVARQAVEKYVEDIAVESTRIRGELGFSPQIDLRTGWRRTVASLIG